MFLNYTISLILPKLLKLSKLSTVKASFSNVVIDDLMRNVSKVYSFRRSANVTSEEAIKQETYTMNLLKLYNNKHICSPGPRSCVKKRRGIGNNAKRQRINQRKIKIMKNITRNNDRNSQRNIRNSNRNSDYNVQRNNYRNTPQNPKNVMSGPDPHYKTLRMRSHKQETLYNII